MGPHKKVRKAIPRKLLTRSLGRVKKARKLDYWLILSCADSWFKADATDSNNKSSKRNHWFKSYGGCVECQRAACLIILIQRSTRTSEHVKLRSTIASVLSYLLCMMVFQNPHPACPQCDATTTSASLQRIHIWQFDILPRDTVYWGTVLWLNENRQLTFIEIETYWRVLSVHIAACFW